MSHTRPPLKIAGVSLIFIFMGCIPSPHDVRGKSCEVDDDCGEEYRCVAKKCDVPGSPTTIWKPSPGTSWQWQLVGAIDTTIDASVFVLDLFEVSDTTIQTLHEQGRIVVCQFEAGTWESWQPDATNLPASGRGKSTGSSGEQWVDIRSPEVRAFVSSRFDRAVGRQCDAVLPAGMDTYSEDTGFPLMEMNQSEYNLWLAEEAHRRGLSVGLNNDVEQIGALVSAFDWSLNTECFRYDECELLAPFIGAGKAVFHVEYGMSTLASTVCPVTKPLGFSTIIKNKSVDDFRVVCP